jgi:hypothetical protein
LFLVERRERRRGKDAGVGGGGEEGSREKERCRYVVK